MKKTILLFSIFALPMALHAEEKRNNVIVGASIGMWNYKQNCTPDLTPYTVEFSASYSLYPYLDIVGNMGMGIVDDSKIMGQDALGNNVEGKVNVNNYLGLYLKPKIDFEHYGLYALLGYARTRVEVTQSGQEMKENHYSLSYGVGGLFPLTSSSSITAEWRQQFDRKAYSLSGLTLGYRYEFN